MEGQDYWLILQYHRFLSDVQLQNDISCITFPVQARIIGRDSDKAHIVCIVI